MKILITGANGLLGHKVIEELEERKIEYIATARGEARIPSQFQKNYKSLDVANKEEVINFFNANKIDTVIHCAAKTNVDACETEPEDTWNLNVVAVGNLVEACIKHHVHLVHLSTDFIFDGTKGMLTEDEKPNPLSIYGKSKLAAEELIRTSRVSFSILRTILVFGMAEGLQRSNIVLWAKESLSNNKQINVVTDQFRTPTFAEDLANACIEAALRKAQGIYNISGPDYFSIYELVEQIAESFQLDMNLVMKSKSSDFVTAAPRPPKTGFIIDKARKELNYNPRTFKESIDYMKQKYAL